MYEETARKAKSGAIIGDINSSDIIGSSNAPVIGSHGSFYDDTTQFLVVSLESILYLPFSKLSMKTVKMQNH